MNSKQFAWTYLIDNGMAGRKPSYYGGYDYYKDVAKQFPEAEKNRWDYRYPDLVKEHYLLGIRTVGVDWAKTEAPKSDSISEFQGTFTEASRKEYLFGELILRNGLKQQWCAPAIEVTNVFDMMEKVSEGEGKFVEIFGNGDQI